MKNTKLTPLFLAISLAFFGLSAHAHNTKKTPSKRAVAAVPSEVKLEQKQENAALLGVDLFHVPAGHDKENTALWEEKLTYEEVTILFDKVPPVGKYDKESVYEISLINHRVNDHLDSNSLFKQKEDKKIFVVSGDVSMNHIKHNFYANPEDIQSVSVKNTNKYCQFISLHYQLNKQEMPNTTTVFVDKKGDLHTVMPVDCVPKLSEYSRESTFHTEGGNIINIGYNQGAMNKESKLSFNMHATKNGKDFYPSDLEGFAIKEDFSQIYLLNKEYDKRGPFFGTKLESLVSSGNYNVVFSYNNNAKHEFIKVKTNVR